MDAEIYEFPMEAYGAIQKTQYIEIILEELFGENTLFYINKEMYERKKENRAKHYAKIWRIDEVMEVVNAYGVIEAIDYIVKTRDFILMDFLTTNDINVRYREIFYYILFDYITHCETDYE